jgi:hypothetical protein
MFFCFAKAFDCVKHNVLVWKLTFYGTGVEPGSSWSRASMAEKKCELSLVSHTQTGEF